MIPVKTLMTRLWNACKIKPEFGGDLWGRGLEVIQRNRGVIIYLSKFEPTDKLINEQPTMDIEITQL